MHEHIRLLRALALGYRRAAAASRQNQQPGNFHLLHSHARAHDDAADQLQRVIDEAEAKLRGEVLAPAAAPSETDRPTQGDSHD